MHKLGLGDVDLLDFAQSRLREIRNPGKPGRGFLEIGCPGQMVDRLRISLSLPGHRAPCQGRFQPHDRKCRPLRPRFVETRELKHPGNVTDVFSANLRRAGVWLQVVVSIGKPQAALVHLGDGARALLGVRDRSEDEARRDTHPM